MDSLPMNPTDIVVLGVLLLSGFLALARGFVHEVLSIIGWIVAYFGSMTLGPVLAPMVSGLLEKLPSVKNMVQSVVPLDQVLPSVSTAIAFLIVVAVWSAFSYLISSRIRASILGPADRMLGLVFGVLRGALIVSLAYLLLAWLWRSDEEPSWLADARTRPMLVTGSNVLRSAIPEKWQESFQFSEKDDKNDDASDGKETPVLEQGRNETLGSP